LEDLEDSFEELTSEGFFEKIEIYKIGGRGLANEMIA
jgi:hypothetical protein